jgi:hypothetical protein
MPAAAAPPDSSTPTPAAPTTPTPPAPTAQADNSFGTGDIFGAIANGLTASQMAKAQYAQLNAANQMSQRTPTVGDLLAGTHPSLVLNQTLG